MKSESTKETPAGLDDLYRSPDANLDEPSSPSIEQSEAEDFRVAHKSREYTIRFVGSLYLVLGFACLYAAWVVHRVVEYVPDEEFLREFMTWFFAGYGSALVLSGIGLRVLARWGQVGSIVVSVVGLANYPVGTVINGLVLWLMIGERGRTVFSRRYRDVIARTRHLDYRMSPLLKYSLFALLGILAWLVVRNSPPW